MNLGIVGSGDIVSGMIPLFKTVDRINCCSLCCRKMSFERGKTLVAKYGIPSIYTNLEQFLKDENIDTVYVAVINQYHYEIVKKALDSGKNVICEKPFTTTLSEGIELVNIAKKNKLLLYEMSRSVHTKNFEKIKSNISKLGKIRMVTSNLCHYSRRYKDYLHGEISYVFDPKYGGALADFGIYSLHYMVGLFGKPSHYSYESILGYNGVDLSGVLSLTYSDFVSINTISKCSNGRPYCCIQGENGYLYCDSSPMFCEKAELVLNDGTRQIICEDADRRDEMSYLEKAIGNKNYDDCEKSMEETLTCIEIIEGCKR